MRNKTKVVKDSKSKNKRLTNLTNFHCFEVILNDFEVNISDFEIPTTGFEIQQAEFALLSPNGDFLNDIIFEPIF